MIGGPYADDYQLYGDDDAYLTYAAKANDYFSEELIDNP